MSTLPYRPFICVGCGKPTQQSPVFHPRNEGRVFPSMCIDCVLAGRLWSDWPAEEISRDMVEAATSADESSRATVRVQVALYDLLRACGSRFGGGS